MNGPGTMEHALQRTADPAWVLDADGYDPLREGSLELRFAISNGFLGIRGARATTRGARWIVPPRTYVAGLFDTSAGTERAISGLVPAADWVVQSRILLPGGPLLHHPSDLLGDNLKEFARQFGQANPDARLLGPGEGKTETFRKSAKKAAAKRKKKPTLPSLASDPSFGGESPC